MSTKSVAFESGHTEMVHDAQLDYYGKKLATASSDKTIRIFEITPNQEQKFVAQLKGHDGPVWQVAWAHPKFGNVLASCSYDGKVYVWKETQTNVWSRISEFTLAPQGSVNAGSVNAISWAPHACGLVLAAACSDGHLCIFTHRGDQQWDRAQILAHQGGCHAVSWGPETLPGALLQQQQTPQGPVCQLVTGGGDNQLKVWRQDPMTGQWASQTIGQHRDWVRDVAWAPGLGLLHSTIASCSEDKAVGIWSQEAGGQWKKSTELPFKHKVWRVSWSTMGNVLAISQGDNKVSLWKESVDGQWQQISTVQE